MDRRLLIVVLGLTTVLTTVMSLDMKRYSAALKNRAKLKKLFKAKFGHKNYDNAEIAERLPGFKDALKLVVANNKDSNKGWISDINFLADKTAVELKKWLMTVNWNTNNKAPVHPTHPIEHNGVREINWVERGVVIAEAKDQTEDCRACWAFAAVVAIDGRYRIITNSSVDFSEQELIDCVYYIRGREQDGCYGGQMIDVYDYVRKYGRLATATALPYEHVAHGKCDYDDIKNGLKEAHMASWKLLEPSDLHHIDALLEGPISVAVQTTQSFLFYKSGVFRDESCMNLIPNHAVAMVGYDEKSYLIKNSWGNQWGLNGYMRSSRGHHGCGLIYYSIVPKLVKGAPETKPLPGPPDDCRDEWGEEFCAKYLAYCTYYTKWCTKSCTAC